MSKIKQVFSLVKKGVDELCRGFEWLFLCVKHTYDILNASRKHVTMNYHKPKPRWLRSRLIIDFGI